MCSWLCLSPEVAVRCVRGCVCSPEVAVRCVRGCVCSPEVMVRCVRGCVCHLKWRSGVFGAVFVT